MAADFGFVANPAQRHPNELAPCRLRYRLPQGSLPDAGRAYKAQDWAGDLVDPLLDGDILENALFDFFQGVVVAVEDLLRFLDIALYRVFHSPRDFKQPVQIIPDDCRFRRHRSHLTKLAQFAERPFLRFFGEFRFGDLFFKIRQFRFFTVVAQLLLNGFHLLVEVVFFLSALHLRFYAAADLLFNLKYGKFGFDKRKNFFESVVNLA